MQGRQIGRTNQNASKWILNKAPQPIRSPQKISRAGGQRGKEPTVGEFVTNLPLFANYRAKDRLHSGFWQFNCLAMPVIGGFYLGRHTHCEYEKPGNSAVQ
jgi:hypothetical protein